MTAVRSSFASLQAGLLATAVAVGALACSARVQAQTCEDLTGVFSARLPGATSGLSADAASCGGGDAPEKRLTYTAPRTGTYVIDTLGSSFDTVLYIRSQGGAELACNDDIEVGVNSLSRVSLTLAAGQVVQIVVDGFGTQSGDYVLRINGDCPLPFRTDPRDLAGVLLGSVSGTTTCAANLLSGSQCGDGGGSTPDAVFVYTVRESGIYEFSTEGSNFDTIISVRLGTCGGAELACNDDIVPGSNQQSRVSVALSDGQTVVIGVDGFGVKTGNFVLSVNGQPSTPTVTATRTASYTASVTPTRTATPTVTATPSATATRSATGTATHTPTHTPTRTPTATRTATLTRTPTATATATLSRTPTGTHSATSTPSVTSTPSITLTPSLTATATATRTATVTRTATTTPTTTATPSITSSGTPTRTDTPTRTASASPTITATGTSSATPPPSRTATRTATTTSTPTPSASPSPTVTPTPTFDGLGCCQRLEGAPSCDAPLSFQVCEAIHGIFVPGAECRDGSCVGGSPVPTVTQTPTPTPTATWSRTPTATATTTPTPTPHQPGCCQRQLPEPACAGPISFAACLASGGEFTEGGSCAGAVCVANPPTPTPSPSTTRTPTITPTATPTPTVTPTMTPTPTGTPTRTSTATATASPTSSATSTATPTPSSTVTPTPPPTLTQAPTSTVTPTFSAIPLMIRPASGIAGSALTVEGQISPASAGVRAFFATDDGNELQPLGDALADSGGAFRLTVLVPGTAIAGRAAVCVATLAPGVAGADLSCADFLVLPTPLGSVIGTVVDRQGAALPNATVRLVEPGGLVAQSILTNLQGGYAFTAVEPGSYELQARCPAASPCSISATHFTPRTVFVAPGATLNVTLVGTAAPRPAVLAGVGGVALPGGILLGDMPVRVLNQATDPAAQLGSLAGLGAPPLTVRFWADVHLLAPQIQTRSVRFEIRRAAEVLASRTAAAPQPVLAGDPVYGFPAFVADFNVNDLPAGNLTLVVSAAVDGTVVDSRNLTLRMHDLAGRWSARTIDAGQLSAVTLSHELLEYRLSGDLPLPPFVFVDRLDFNFGVQLDNTVYATLPFRESFRTDGSWDGRVEASVAAGFLGGTAPELFMALNGPAGSDLSEATYGPSMSQGAVADTCLELPAMTYRSDLSLQPCVECATINASTSSAAALCRKQRVVWDAALDANIALDARAAPAWEEQPALEISTDQVLCEGALRMVPQTETRMAVAYDSRLAPPLRYAAAPCVRLGGSVEQRIDCAGGTLAPRGGATTELISGCRGSRGRGASAIDTAAAAPRPAVAADGTGNGMALWVQDAPTLPAQADRRIYFSVSDGVSWSVPQPLTAAGTVVDAPQVAFLGSNDALAVWVQSRLSPAQAATAGSTELLANSELAYARWNGREWSAPQAITNDNVADVMPALAGDSGSGTATLVWLRAQPRQSSQPLAVYAARFDAAWSPPQQISGPPGALDRTPAVAMYQGTAAAVWVREIDSNLTTSEDRRIVWSRLEGSDWSSPAEISGLPPGAYAPSLAFDGSGLPVLAFLVPEVDIESGLLRSGDGSASHLWAARQVGERWIASAVGTVRAERPVLRIAAERAVLLFRWFEAPESTGNLGLGVADLGEEPLTWRLVNLSGDGAAHTHGKLAVDAAYGTVFIADAVRADAGAPAQVERRILPAQADLAIDPKSLRVSDTHPGIGDVVRIALRLQNRGLGEVDQEAVEVAVYDGGVRAITRTVAAPRRFGDTVEVDASYTTSRGGLRALTVIVDEPNRLPEIDKSNNRVATEIGALPAPHALSSTVDEATLRAALFWNPPQTSGIAAYRIYRLVTSAPPELVAGSIAPAFSGLPVVEGRVERYAVSAVDTFGVESPLSEPVVVLRREPQMACTGDCNGDGEVTIDELLIGVNIALDLQPLSRCAAFDAGGDGMVTIDELLAAVNNALGGC